MEFLIIDCFNPTIEPVDFRSSGLKLLVILLGICFCGVVLEGVVEEIGEGKKGDASRAPTYLILALEFLPFAIPVPQ
jgi:hypothetical protein